MSLHLLAAKSCLVINICPCLNVLQNLVTFPIELFVTKLSGSGQDSIFLGVVRKHATKPEGNQTMSAVRVFTTPTGTILCADEQFYNTFGLDSQSLVGRPFTSLGPNVELLQK
jgi:hypothetical protein